MRCHQDDALFDGDLLIPDGAEAEQPHEETVEFHCDKVLIGKRTQNIGMPSANG